ncbi:MAG: hypothetical protein V4488_19030, partial [Pseudomonadota bacterium]
PDYAVQKMGNGRNSPSAQTHPFLIHFLYRTIGEAPSGLQVKDNSNVKNNGNQILQRSKKLIF